MAQGHSGDEAVLRLTDRLAAAAAAAVEVGGGLVVSQSLDRQELEASEEPPQLGHVVGVGGPGEQLQVHDLSGRQRRLTVDELTQASVDGAAGSSQVLDPSRGVGQDHDLSTGALVSGGMSAARSSSRSPLQPLPSMGRASSRLIGSPANRRRASSTAARLLGNR